MADICSVYTITLLGSCSQVLGYRMSVGHNWRAIECHVRRDLVLYAWSFPGTCPWHGFWNCQPFQSDCWVNSTFDSRPSWPTKSFCPHLDGWWSLFDLVCGDMLVTDWDYRLAKLVIIEKHIFFVLQGSTLLSIEILQVCCWSMIVVTIVLVPN